MNTDHTQAIAQYFADSMRREFRSTCKVIAAVPDSGHHYKPDEKSRTAWELATHLATADVWFLNSIADGAFVWNENAGLPAEMTNTAGVVAWYEKAYPAAVDRVAALSADHLTRVIDFFGMKMPAVALVALANNHGIHHRGQLASYLRAMGSKVPAIYGMSADENAMGG